MSAEAVYRSCRVARVMRALPADDGDGLRVSRIIGTAALDYVDPVLLFEVFRSSQPVTYFEDFDDHPSRGFEIVTYMLQGQRRHSNNLGHEGLVSAGGAQWLTTGRGVIHSEMPVAEGGDIHGVTLWLNLPARDKRRAPRCRDITPEDIPAVIFEGGEVRLLAGRFHGLIGPIAPAVTEPLIADVQLRHEGEVSIDIPQGHQGFVYVFDGGVAIERTLVNPGQAGLIGDGNRINLVAGRGGGRALVVAARPLNEAVFRHGSFISSTAREADDSISDYWRSRLARRA